MNREFGTTLSFINQSKMKFILYEIMVHRYKQISLYFMGRIRNRALGTCTGRYDPRTIILKVKEENKKQKSKKTAEWNRWFFIDAT